MTIEVAERSRSERSRSERRNRGRALRLRSGPGDAQCPGEMFNFGHMNLNDIMTLLERSGSAQTKKILMNHGAREPAFGVKIEDMKKLLKGIKGDNALAAELFGTGNYDAMYLAGLITDGSKMTPDEIRGWANVAYGSAISEYIVPWVTAENRAGYELAKEWIELDDPVIATTGWSAFSSILSVWKNEDLDLQHLRSLLEQVEREIQQSPDRVRAVMNIFVISLGSYVPELTDECLAAAGRIGTVTVVKQGTSCKVPSAAEYIIKVQRMGRTGVKKKIAKC